MYVRHVGVRCTVLSIFLHICHFQNKKVGKKKARKWYLGSREGDMKETTSFRIYSKRLNIKFERRIWWQKKKQV